jgi:hypothetical protein
MKKNDTVLYLDTNMDAGHGGASGRFEALKELAKEFTFLFRIDYKIVVVYYEKSICVQMGFFEFYKTSNCLIQ